MKWIKERDLFIAQTMAFVQSVTGKKPVAEARQSPRNVLFQSPLAKSAPVGETAEQDGPVEPFNAEPFNAEPLRADTVQAGNLRIETSQIDTGQVARPSPVL